MKISKINNLDFETLMRIMSSTQINEIQKTQFIKNNLPQINKIMVSKISSSEFKTLMDNRALIKFRPLKNSFTKRGDKVILAKALSINPGEIKNYIKNTTQAIREIDNLKFLSPDKMEILKTYVYRHGSKDDLVAFLDYELIKTKDITKTLYRTLEYYSGGVADYFIRPIHRMDNKTLVKIYNVIDKHIRESFSTGKISEADSKKMAKWALIKIYQIQNNSKLINAIKTYKTLS